MQFLPCPAFAQHSNTNMERLVAAIRQARPAEQQPEYESGGGWLTESQPGQTAARNFEATAPSGDDAFRSRRSNHRQHVKSEGDHDQGEG
jgi:hypothetical protein